MIFLNIIFSIFPALPNKEKKKTLKSSINPKLTKNKGGGVFKPKKKNKSTLTSLKKKVLIMFYHNNERLNQKKNIL